jgi:predicted DsbA family dithiol-disulfide isomerase
MAECGKMEVRGAPGFLINGRLLSGAQPFERFKMVFEEELNGGFEATQKKEAAAKAAAGGKPVEVKAPAK